MINVSSKGTFHKTDDYLKRMKKNDIFSSLEKYGAQGVAALAAATPIDSSETQHSWGYEIKRKKGYYSIIWTNTHNDGGPPVAILLQYGHATRNGGFVQGYDYIMPAIRPVFDRIAAEVFKEVSR